MQAIIFICQVDGVWGYPSSSSLSWAVVFIPTYLGGIIHLSILSSRYHFAKRQALSSLLAGGPTRGGDTNVALLQASICCFVVMGIMFYAGLALFITRMGNVTSDPTSTTPTAAVVMVPVFIVLSLLFCCVCCCLPCSTMGMRQSLEDELSEMSSAGRMYELVSYKKRITWQQQQQQQQLQQGGGGPSKVVQSTSMEPLVQ